MEIPRVFGVRARPVWHHAAPAGAGQEPYISAYPGANWLVP